MRPTLGYVHQTIRQNCCSGWVWQFLNRYSAVYHRGSDIVQRFSFLGKGISVIASRTELFPDDWLPQTTSCGRETIPSSPHCLSESTILRTYYCSSLWRASRDDVEIGMCYSLSGESGIAVEFCSSGRSIEIATGEDSTRGGMLAEWL
jgi:hypothetical protein